MSGKGATGATPVLRRDLELPSLATPPPTIDSETLVNVVRGLVFLLPGTREAHDDSICPRFVELMGHRSHRIRTCILANIVKLLVDDELTQVCVATGLWWLGWSGLRGLSFCILLCVGYLKGRLHARVSATYMCQPRSPPPSRCPIPPLVNTLSSSW